MNIRLMGTKEELDAFKEYVKNQDWILEVSNFYPNRGTTKLGRMYITTITLNEGSFKIEGQEKPTLPNPAHH